MTRSKVISKINKYLLKLTFIFLFLISFCFGANVINADADDLYKKWYAVGKTAAENSLGLLKEKNKNVISENLILMTNAGYAEIGGETTEAAIDGAVSATGVLRGKKSFLEIHSSFQNSLWFALYDKDSNFCAYYDVVSLSNVKYSNGAFEPADKLFQTKSIERIDAEFLYAHVKEYAPKFKNKMFGGNEFRIITIANAVSAGAPFSAVRAFEFHDHYCPGVVSGILMVDYVKKHFPSGNKGYFVHSVSPWCKEDAFLSLLNATPGKRGYAVDYPGDEDMKNRDSNLKDASTIFYRKNEDKDVFEGVVLSFEWAKDICKETGNMLIDKLCMDMWYLERIDKSEDFVKVLKKFELKKGISPNELARPGKDPLAEIAGLPAQ